MPYKHAHYFVGFVLLVIMAGFWASYFAPFATVPLAFHVHAVTASSWLLLLIVQHLSIHRRANSFHRQLGKASFVLFPLLMLGFAMIVTVSAERFAAAESPAILHNGPAFGIGMVIAMAGYCTLFYLALKNRRSVRLHAGYMLATPLILFESPFSRVIGMYVPWMNVIGSDGPHAVLDTIVIGNALAAALALSLYLLDRKSGGPWLVALFFLMLQSLAMWFSPVIPGLRSSFTAYATFPEGLTLAVGLTMGVAAAGLGWRAGGHSKRPRATTTPRPA
jgi:hypothetical protein